MKDYSGQELDEINKTIEAMPGICADGKKGVRMLVEKLVGKPLASESVKPEAGQLWRATPEGNIYCDILIVRDSGDVRVVFMDTSGPRMGDWNEERIKRELSVRYKLVGRITDVINRNR